MRRPDCHNLYGGWESSPPPVYAPCPVSEPSCPDAFVSLGFVINDAYSKKKIKTMLRSVNNGYLKSHKILWELWLSFICFFIDSSFKINLYHF
jgi:hypothetical protein